MGTRYEIIRSIAKGGMAEVFRARAIGETGFAKVVALKRISTAFGSDPQALRMLMDEARLALRLDHPNIVQVFEFGRDDEGYFIAMEFVDGPDLARVLHERAVRGRALPEACAVYIAVQVLRGLEHAHRLTDERGKHLGVVHRDISPGNVLLTAEGLVKLSDFGIAKAAGRLQTTAVGTVKGKIPYMSPEQLTGGVVDGRSDVFSTALVLWESLAGCRAYEAPDELELIRKVSTGRVRRFKEVGAEVPAALEAIIFAALERDPDRRSPSAGELAKELERYHRRNHPDFTPEYLGALLAGTEAGTQVANLGPPAPARVPAGRATTGPRRTQTPPGGQTQPAVPLAPRPPTGQTTPGRPHPVRRNSGETPQTPEGRRSTGEFRQVSERRQAEDRLAELSAHDHPTRDTLEPYSDEDDEVTVPLAKRPGKGPANK